MTPFNHRRHGDVIRNTQPCPELAEALPALRSWFLRSLGEEG